MKNIKTISLFLLIVTFFSCENLLTKEIDIEDLGYEPQLVLNTNITNLEDTILISLTKNIPIYDVNSKGYQHVQGEIELLMNGESLNIEYIEPFDPDNFFNYRAIVSSNMELSGSSFVVTAKSSGFDDIRATTELPSTLHVLSVEVEEEAVIRPEYSEKFDRLIVTISDHQEEQNFYDFEIHYGVRDTVDIGNGQMEIYEYEGSFTPDFEFDADGDLGDSQLFYKDDLVDGEEFSVNLLSSVNLKFYDWAELIIRSHSRSSYQFLSTYDKYELNQDVGFFSESVTLYSNVENGLGMLMGQIVNHQQLK